MANSFVARRFRSAALLASMAVVFGASTATAQDAGPFAEEINSLRNSINSNIEQVTEFEGTAATIGEAAAGDVEPARKWFNDLIAKYEQTIALFKENKAEEARRLWGECDRAAGGRWIWRNRLERRRRQAELSPNEHWIADRKRYVPNEVMKEFEAFIEARKAASEAWGRAADATSPDLDREQAEIAAEEADAARIRAEVAEMRFNWARENRGLYEKRDLSPELNQRVAELQQAQEELTQLMIQRTEVDRRVRSAERRLRSTTEAARRAFDEARKAAEAKK